MVKGIDGISYLPLLTGNGEVSRSHEYIYYEFYEQGGDVYKRQVSQLSNRDMHAY